MTIIDATVEKANLLINGEWVPSVSGKTFNVYDPAKGQVTAEVADANEEDVHRAVIGAKEAFEDRRWRAISAIERGRILHSIAQRIREEQYEIAQLMTRENGMIFNTALFLEIPLVIECFDYMAGLCSQPTGETLPFSMTGTAPNHFVFTQKEPIGVAGLITPWNFPLLMPAWKIAPALAAGCSAVLKPAPQTPLTALKLAEICMEAGVPEGVIQVVPGTDEAGKALVRHPDAIKIAFTGETATGRHILQSAAPNIKRVTLELGGKSPNIIFNDAKLEEAVNGALFGIFLNSGQVCQAGSRVFVQEEIYEPFVEQIIEKAEKLRVGPGEDHTNDIGPVISKEQYDRILQYVDIGKREGAKLLTGGKRPIDQQQGYFIEPTIFSDVNPEMTIAKEEIFGPVLSIIPFRNEEEVIKMANDSIYGLAAAVWTQDIKRGLRLAQQIQAGTVWLNTIQVLTPTAPFGGFKQSGLGRELGPKALDAYLETKSVIVDLNETTTTFF